MALPAAIMDSEPEGSMRRIQRRLHRYIWLVLPVGLLVIVFMAAVEKPEVEINQAVKTQGGLLP